MRHKIISLFLCFCLGIAATPANATGPINGLHIRLTDDQAALMKSIEKLEIASARQDNVEFALQEFSLLLKDFATTESTSLKRMQMRLQRLLPYHHFPIAGANHETDRQLIRVTLYSMINDFANAVLELQKHPMNERNLQALKLNINSINSDLSYIHYLRMFQYLVLTEKINMDFSELNTFLKQMNLVDDLQATGAMTFQVADQTLGASGVLSASGDMIFPLYTFIKNLKRLKALFAEIKHLRVEREQTEKQLQWAQADATKQNVYLIETIKLRHYFVTKVKLTNKLVEGVRLLLDMAKIGIVPIVSGITLIAVLGHFTIASMPIMAPALAINIALLGIVILTVEQVKIKYWALKLVKTLQRFAYEKSEQWQLKRTDNSIKSWLDAPSARLIASNKELQDLQETIAYYRQLEREENCDEMFEQESQFGHCHALANHRKIVEAQFNYQLVEHYRYAQEINDRPKKEWYDLHLKREQQIAKYSRLLDEVDTKLAGLDLKGMQENEAFLIGVKTKDLQNFRQALDNILVPNTTYYEEFRAFIEHETDIPVKKFDLNPTQAMMNYLFT